MKDLSVSVESLGKKTDSLIKAYRGSKERVVALEKERDRLLLKMQELTTEMDRMKEENKVLKMASAIKGDGDKVTESKRKISQLVREIDRCIATLNE